MFLIIVATIVNCVNAQISAPIQKPSSEQSKSNNQNNQNSATAKYGDTIKEEYTDSDGNIKKRTYRYGFQYKDTFKPTKPSGNTLKESYTDKSGEQETRSYRYGWQYNLDSGSEEKPIKMSSPKMSTPTPADSGGENSASTTPSSSSATAAPSTSSTTAASPLAPSADDIKKKDADILSRMRDLIKERQQLKAGK